MYTKGAVRIAAIAVLWAFCGVAVADTDCDKLNYASYNAISWQLGDSGVLGTKAVSMFQNTFEFAAMSM